MRKFSLVVFILTLTICKAQSWCAPDAEWYYSSGSASTSEFTKINYTGTTTINGYTCQVLSAVRMGYSFMSAQGTFTNNYILNTRISNQVIFLYTGIMPHLFDTLYNFNAVIGNKWRVPNVTSTLCPNNYITVIDTGHKTIQNVWLKWLKVTYNTNSGTTTDTIFERIGSLKYNFYDRNYICPPPTYDSYSIGLLRCYSDNQINNYKQVQINCDYFYTPPTAINTNILNVDDVSIYPNPAKDVVFLKSELFDHKMTQVQLYNVLGQVIFTKELQFNQGGTQLNLSHLPKGVYTLKLVDEDGRSFNQKLVVE